MLKRKPRFLSGPEVSCSTQEGDSPEDTLAAAITPGLREVGLGLANGREPEQLPSLSWERAKAASPQRWACPKGSCRGGATLRPLVQREF